MPLVYDHNSGTTLSYDLDNILIVDESDELLDALSDEDYDTQCFAKKHGTPLSSIINPYALVSPKTYIEIPATDIRDGDILVSNGQFLDVINDVTIVSPYEDTEGDICLVETFFGELSMSPHAIVTVLPRQQK